MNKKILIVSLGTGSGHIRAAKAIEGSVREKDPSASILNIDFLDYTRPILKSFYTGLYVRIVTLAPGLYRFLYKKVTPGSTKARLIFDRINSAFFKKTVFDFDPDVVICTHFVPANLISFWKRSYGLHAKTFMVITDYEAHALWADKGIDQYFVASESTKDDLVRVGIDSDSIFVSGIPIDEKFSKKYNKAEIRKKIGIDSNFTVSIFSGGFGIGPVGEMVSSIKSKISSINVIVVAGKNVELRKKLDSMVEHNKNIKIFGFVNNVEELMAVSDVIVSKPGGLTVAESLSMGVPLIISEPIPGQEEGNARFLLKNKVALDGGNSTKITEVLERLIKEKDLLKKLRANCVNLAKPLASIVIAKEVLKKTK